MKLLVRIVPAVVVAVAFPVRLDAHVVLALKQEGGAVGAVGEAGRCSQNSQNPAVKFCIGGKTSMVCELQSEPGY